MKKLTSTTQMVKLTSTNKVSNIKTNMCNNVPALDVIVGYLDIMRASSGTMMRIQTLTYIIIDAINIAQAAAWYAISKPTSKKVGRHKVYNTLKASIMYMANTLQHEESLSLVQMLEYLAKCYHTNASRMTYDITISVYPNTPSLHQRA